MLDGTQVQFKSVSSNKYVSAQDGGGQNVNVDRDVPSSWETFRGHPSLQHQSHHLQQKHFTLKGITITEFILNFPAGHICRHLLEMSSQQTIQGSQDGMIMRPHSKWQLWLIPCTGITSLPMDMDMIRRKKCLVAYNMKCIINLHAAPGSQNGMEHSSSRDGSTDWPTSQAYISQSLDVIEFLASRYGNHPALLGIELLNEPSASGISLDILVSYYSKGYQIVRNHSSTAYVIICQRIGNADPLELYHANIGYSNVVVDLHYYNLFDDFFSNLSTSENIQFIHKSRQTQVESLNAANGPLVFIGEWVNEWSVANGSQMDYQEFGRAQLDVYDTASFGWAYWTLKNDRNHWDLEWNIKNNYLQLGQKSLPARGYGYLDAGGLPNKQIQRYFWLLVSSCSYFYLWQIL
ncbi:glucan 1,3-beta-glucosidase-like isoform X2 [Papaver somniferum]|nr:glucan 1,3-beta-glucosidase-like isoform X2 [Papaver somniferum]